MIRTNLKQLIFHTLLADGAMGTMLHARGVGFDKCFDELNITNPGAVAKKLRESQNAVFRYAIVLNRRNATEDACPNARTVKAVERDGALLMIVKEIPPGQTDCP